MLPFETPTMLLAAGAATLMLIGIYLFQHRYRQQTVSSLMLWLDQPTPTSGGRRVERFRAPLLFIIELLILLLLGVAACGPFVHRTGSTQPVIVILDDSVSMRAGGDRSPRSQTLAALMQEFQRDETRTFQFIAAGANVQLLGPPISSISQAAPILERWSCRSATAHLADGIALARQINASARLLIVTDHAPDRVGDATIRWWSLGRPIENRAIIVAGRTESANKDRILVEIAANNLTSSHSSLSVFADEVLIQTIPLTLDNAATKRIVFDLPHSPRAIRLQLPDDALADDNVVTLLADQPRVVRIATRIGNDALREHIERAITAGPPHQIVSHHADLTITDAPPTTQESSTTWTLAIADADAGNAFIGPFIVDRTHPLTEGVDLAGVVWASAAAMDPTAADVIFAVGNVPLLVDRVTRTGQHALTMSLRPAASNLMTLPAWPVFFWNLISWRAEHLPGVSNSHVQLGERVTATFDTGTSAVRLQTPSRNDKTFSLTQPTLTLTGDEIGVYELRSDARTFRFGVSLLNRDESDLSQCVGERIGTWPSAAANDSINTPLAWLMILLALGAVTIHHLLLVRRGGMC